MSFDFPSSPSVGQTYSPAPPGPSYIWNGYAWQVYGASPTVATAETKNRVVNPAMQISQQNADAAGTVNGYHPADQWYQSNGTAAVVSAQRVQVATPNGSKDRIRFTVTTADTSIAAGDNFTIAQPIEGTRIADFRYGSTSARQSILRFGWKSPAGTYAMNLRNASVNRSYTMPFTITAGQANTDTVQTFVIPGDTTGTWATDNSLGTYLMVVLTAGTTFQGPSGWQAGNLFGHASMTNGVGTVSNVFELYDVGWYLDPQNTGVPPLWALPDYAAEEATCQRYWARHGYLMLYGYANAGAAMYNGNAIAPSMRAGPAVSIDTQSYANCSALTNNGASSSTHREYATVTATGSAYVSYYINLSSRM